jgi:acid phosphatase (class A)
MKARLIASGIALFVICGTAQTVRTPIFVSPAQLDMSALLPPPPASGSWQEMAEFADLHRIQETRTSERIKHAKNDDAEESIFLFADLLGPKFRRESLPLTAQLSDHVKNDESIIVNPAKTFFKRPRPYHADATLKPVCKTSEDRTNFSYPSGHGTTGYLEALVLIQMIPEKRAAIMARADDYALSREVCGVHYASDEAASKVTAYAMMALMTNNQQFKTELAAAKAELRTSLGL